MGANLASIASTDYHDLKTYLAAVQVILHYFDYNDQRRVAQAKAAKTKQGKKKHVDSIVEEPATPVLTPVHTASSKFSLKNKLFGRKKDVHPTTPLKKKRGFFHRDSSSEHVAGDGYDYDDSDDDLLTNTAPSLASPRPNSNRLLPHPSNLSDASGSQSSSAASMSTSTTSSAPGATTAAAKATTAANAANAAEGTGLCTMGPAKTKFHRNLRATHPAVNQNLLSRTLTASSAGSGSSALRTESAQAVLANLVVVSEQDLPFHPDPVESMLTLLDVVMGIYRGVAHALAHDPTPMTRHELAELDSAVRAVEVILRRTVVTDGLAMLDRDQFKRPMPRSKDLIERDILRVSSQPGTKQSAVSPGKCTPTTSAQFMRKMSATRPETLLPQSRAMYV